MAGVPLNAPGVPYGASQYIGSLPLPPSARPDLAFQMLKTLGQSQTETGKYIVPGTQYWLPLSLRAVFTTSATVGTRIFVAEALLADGTVLWQVPANAGVGPGAQFVFTLTPDTTAAYGPVNKYFAMPLPQAILYPTNELDVLLDGSNNDDTLNTSQLLVLAIPSGPGLTAAPATLTPTPLLA